MNLYDYGDLIRVRTTAAGVFTDIESGNAFDPDTVVIKYIPPTGAQVSKTYVTDAEVIKTGTGAYYMDIDTRLIEEAVLFAVSNDVWKYRIEGISAGGSAQGAAEGRFKVARTEFA